MTDMEEKLQSPPPQPQSTPNIDALLARLSQTGGYDLEKVKKPTTWPRNTIAGRCAARRAVYHPSDQAVAEIVADLQLDTDSIAPPSSTTSSRTAPGTTIWR